MLWSMRRETKFGLVAATVFVALYLLLAYILLPSTWRHYEHQKKLATLAMVTHTRDGIPGDPINVGLVGSKEGRTLCHEGRGVVSGRSGYAALKHCHCRQRAFEPAIPRCAGEPFILRGQAARPGL